MERVTEWGKDIWEQQKNNLSSWKINQGSWKDKNTSKSMENRWFSEKFFEWYSNIRNFTRWFAVKYGRNMAEILEFRVAVMLALIPLIFDYVNITRKESKPTDSLLSLRYSSKCKRTAFYIRSKIQLINIGIVSTSQAELRSDSSSKSGYDKKTNEFFSKQGCEVLDWGITIWMQPTINW